MSNLVEAGNATVSIISYTGNPIKTIAAAQRNMVGHMMHNLMEISDDEAREIFLDCAKTELQGAFEFVHFNIQMDGVSRAFQQQLTRTRLAAYSAESLRFTESGMNVLVGPHLVATDEGYWASDAPDESPRHNSPREMYQIECNRIEATYNALLLSGVPTEDARGILPLNVLSRVGMSVSYKTLIHMSRVRMCYQSQAGEWGDVFRKILDLLEIIDPLLVKPMGAFCDAGQKCPFGSVLDRKCDRAKQ